MQDRIDSSLEAIESGKDITIVMSKLPSMVLSIYLAKKEALEWVLEEK